MRGSSLALLVLLAAGCWTPNPPDGAFACNPSGKACPDGYSCVAGSCWKNGHAADMAVDPSCMDGVKDGTESDVDCGGSCAKCDTGKSCAAGDDCATTYCSATTSLCVPSSCEDGVVSAGETDVDCGGTTCPGCVVGKACTSNSDCASMNCDGSTHVCVSLQCQDGMRNGNETDVDCGGGVCAPCDNGKKCLASMDCVSTFCASTSKVCVPSRCQDETKNGSETDIDCGGACPKCGPNLVCNVAGDCVTGSCLHSFCALSSGPPNWVAVAPVTARYAMGVATGGDGKIYAIGGLTSGSLPPVNTVEAYAPNQWASGPPYPSTVANACATTAADGTIYVIAGATSNSSSSLVQAVNILTPGVGWSAGPSLPIAIDAFGCATGSDGKIYSIGGDLSSGPTAQSYALTPGGSWTAIADLPVADVGRTAAVGTDGRIYAIGGLHSDGTNITFATSVYAFSPSTGQWTTAADLSVGRFEHASVAGSDGRIYVFGGGGSGGALGSCEAYTPSTNAWVPCASLGTAREYLGGAVGSDGRVYAVGGYTGSAVGTVEAYGPAVAMAPTSGQAGASISLSGSNFAANANVSVRFGVPTGQVLGTGVTDSSGALVAPISFKIPAVTPAAYRVFVSDDRSQYPVNATLTVTP